jgi:uridine monophosphate synthetase
MPNMTRDSWGMEQSNFISLLKSRDYIQFGTFELADGQLSPYYFDFRKVISYPSDLELIGEKLYKLSVNIQYDVIAAIPYAAIPLGVAMSFAAQKPLIYFRKEVHQSGTKRLIEGEYIPGQIALLLDDVITTGESKLKARKIFEDAGLIVDDLVVLADRRSENANLDGLRLISLLSAKDLIGE